MLRAPAPFQRITLLACSRVSLRARLTFRMACPLLPLTEPAPLRMTLPLLSRTHACASDRWSTRRRISPLPPGGQRAAPPFGVASARMPAAYQNGSVDAGPDLTQSASADPSKSTADLPSRLVHRAPPPAGRPLAGQPSAEPKYLRLRKERNRSSSPKEGEERRSFRKPMNRLSRRLAVHRPAGPHFLTKMGRPPSPSFLSPSREFLCCTRPSSL